MEVTQLPVFRPTIGSHGSSRFVTLTHQPTRDDGQQLLQVLFKTEEREEIVGAARKLVPGANGIIPMRCSLSFGSTDRDFNTAVKERLRVYHQILMRRPPRGHQMAYKLI